MAFPPIIKSMAGYLLNTLFKYRQDKLAFDVSWRNQVSYVLMNNYDCVSRGVRMFVYAHVYTYMYAYVRIHAASLKTADMRYLLITCLQ